jgi:hypothetical protein
MLLRILAVLRNLAIPRILVIVILLLVCLICGLRPAARLLRTAPAQVAQPLAPCQNRLVAPARSPCRLVRVTCGGLVNTGFDERMNEQLVPLVAPARLAARLGESLRTELCVVVVIFARCGVCRLDDEVACQSSQEGEEGCKVNHRRQRGSRGEALLEWRREGLGEAGQLLA